MLARCRCHTTTPSNQTLPQTSGTLSTARDHCSQHMATPLPSANLPWAVPRRGCGTCVTEPPVPPPWQQSPCLPRTVPSRGRRTRAVHWWCHAPSERDREAPHHLLCRWLSPQPPSAEPLQPDHYSQHAAVTLRLLHALHKALEQQRFDGRQQTMWRHPQWCF